MSQTAFAEMLTAAREQRRAIGAFTCYDSNGLEAVIAAAESRAAPVIVLVSPSSFVGATGARLIAGFAAAAARSTVDVLVQLDHTSDRAALLRAPSAGFGAVMADGSRLPFAENAALARFAVETAESVGVEAELGRVEGDEDRAGPALVGSLTDPREVARFVEQSGVDCLAVAVGNVHGRYVGVPEIDWQRLSAIVAETDVPLALHGASGLPGETVRRAIEIGVAKVNVNTELRAAYFDELDRSIADCRSELDLNRLSRGVSDAVRQAVEEKLDLLGWSAEAAA